MFASSVADSAASTEGAAGGAGETTNNRDAVTTGLTAATAVEGLGHLRRKYERPPPLPDDEAPLWKILRAGMTVEARFSGDGRWYEATITQVTHGGYANASYTCRFVQYGDEEARSWRDINLLPGSQRILDEGEASRQKRPRGSDPIAAIAGATSLEPTGLSARAAGPAAVNPTALTAAAKGGWRARAKGQR